MHFCSASLNQYIVQLPFGVRTAAHLLPYVLGSHCEGAQGLSDRIDGIGEQ